MAAYSRAAALEALAAAVDRDRAERPVPRWSWHAGSMAAAYRDQGEPWHAVAQALPAHLVWWFYDARTGRPIGGEVSEDTAEAVAAIEAGPGNEPAVVLREIRERVERVWEQRGTVGGLLAINDAREDVPRLLAALAAVLALADGSCAIMHGSPPEHDLTRAVGDPIAWNLSPVKVRDAIARALAGEVPVDSLD